MNDGGPAYPRVLIVTEDTDDTGFAQDGGMSLRDYYAGKAIGLFSMSEEDVIEWLNGGKPMHKMVARFCFQLADAMIAERDHANG